MEHEHQAPPIGSPSEAPFWLSAILHSTDDAIVAKDGHGRVLSWSKGAQSMFGYSDEEIIGRPITILFPQERLAEEELILARAHRGETLSQLETTRRSRDGRDIPVSISVSPVQNASGELLGILKVARKRGAPLELQSALLRREALLRAILDTVPDALVIGDDRGLIQAFSVGAERMFGIRAAEAVGRNVSLLMPHPYQREHDAYIGNYLATGERHIIGIGRVAFGRRANGSTFPMQLHVGEAAVPGARMFTGFVRDLTERQEGERHLDELQAEFIHLQRLNETAELIAALANETSQPITAMIMFVEVIRRQLHAAEAQLVEPALQGLAEQSERLRQLVGRLRGLVERDWRKRGSESLAHIIEEAVAVALVGVGQDLELDIHIGDGAGRAFVDRVQIKHVLFNLIRNSVDAMLGMERRRLSVMATRADDMVEVCVADTGHGLMKHIREKLFEAFVSTKANHIGVGLAFCRAVVAAHKGTITAADAEGGGTIVRFTIPAAN